MSEVLDIKKDKQKNSCQTYIDGTGRLQTVTREMNENIIN